MSLQIGIVGLPNVGKSTLFNALIRGAKADAKNYPFCTIEPNVGIVEVPDERLAPLAQVSKSKKIVPAAVEFVDIAGLVRGANKGEGLGNQFLAHIRECDAIAMVVRFFEDENVTHIEGKIDPKSDVETIETELQLADMATVEKRLFLVEKEMKSGSKESRIAHGTLQKIKNVLHSGRNAREVDLNEEESKELKSLSLLTTKPILYIANCSEEQLNNLNTTHTDLFHPPATRQQSSSLGGQQLRAGRKDTEINKSENQKVGEAKKLKSYNLIPISAKIESELNELTDEEKKEYLNEVGLDDTGLNRLIKEAYKTLGLITYFTSGEQETRAWTVRNGAKAPEAAGVIHTDFEKGFIAADVVGWLDLVNQEGWSGARSKGLVRTEGKTYTVRDGDVMLFKFNV
jgi:ribosome-binding ATPase YchF (GTP1/OBG family)